MSDVVSLGVFPIWEPSLNVEKIEGFILNNQNIEEFSYFKEKIISELIDETTHSIKEQTQKWVNHWLLMDGLRTSIEEYGSVEIEMCGVCAQCKELQNNTSKTSH